MNEISFFQSPAFFILIGRFIGFVIGAVGMAVLGVSGRASLDEENMLLRHNLEKVKESLAKCIASRTKRFRKP